MGYISGMVSRRDIGKYVDSLARSFAPERVILYGSYARGDAGDDSDVDMLVIMEHNKRKDVEQAVTIAVTLT
jgi:predicted nucleotidyltransferase